MSTMLGEAGHNPPPGVPYAVIDASVSLKWVLDDEDAVLQAVALRDAALGGEFEMVAPSIWLFELVNGLVTATRMGRLTSQAGVRALSLVLTLGVQLADPPAQDMYEQAIHNGLAAYDSAYLALATALDAPLWTGDRRFYDIVQAKMAGATDLHKIYWIGDYAID